MTGKVALVTGASDGLGRHFAETLAAAGAAVVLGARRADKLADAVAEIVQAGGSAIAVTIDVTSEASVASAFREIDRRVGPVNVVVNNAGTEFEGRLARYARSRPSPHRREKARRGREHYLDSRRARCR
jgi:NAD(P)-dependent dehydrogenase (short-subunit alcohol dehydrogenase family)